MANCQVVFNQQEGKLLINNKLASDNLYEQRRKLGLCFKCGEKFTPGHRCVTKRLNMIEGLEDCKEEFF